MPMGRFLLLGSLVIGCQPKLPEGIDVPCDNDDSCAGSLRCVRSAPDDYPYPEVYDAIGTCQVACAGDLDCYFRGMGDRREHCAVEADPPFCFHVWLY